MSGALALLVVLAGCAAGQQAQTSEAKTASGGIDGRVGSIVVRDAQFTFDGPISGDTVYQPGDDAPLQVTIINDANAADANTADRLVSVESAVAMSGRIVGDARIPDGHTLTAGYDAPVAPGAASVDITLLGLTSPVRAGLRPTGN